MPKIISAFQSGPSNLAETMSQLGRNLWGNSTENAINGEKLYAAQRANTELDNLMRRVADAKAQNLGADPTVQAILIGSGFDPANFAEIGRMGAATEFGAADPRTANWQIAAGQTYDATAPAFNAKIAEQRYATDLNSADNRYKVDKDNATDLTKWTTPSANEQIQSGDRRYAVDQGELTKRMEPIAAFDPATNQPTLVQKRFATTRDMQPILSENDRIGMLLGQNWLNLPGLNPQQQEVLGARVDAAKSGTPKNYIVNGKTYLTVDGITDVMGNPLPPGGYLGTVQGSATDTGVTNAVRTDLQSDMISADRFTGLAGRMLDMTQKDPAAFGLVGNVMGKMQEGRQALNAIGFLFGGEQGAKQLADEAKAELSRNGLGQLIPEVYNPNYSSVQMLGGLLLYSAASALGGQENRSVSDKDIQMMRSIIGDPQGMFESAQSIQTKVKTALDIVAEHKRLAQQYLQAHPGQAIPPEAGLVEAATANVMSRGAQQPQTEQQNNQPVQIKGAADYDALPVGAQYLDPNGVLRTKGAR